MRLRRAFTITCLCVFAAWHPVGDAAGAYTLSRGRQVLLDRGLQIQAVTYPYPYMSLPSFNLDLWLSANFTTLNLHAWPDSEVLSRLPPGTQFARTYAGHLDASGAIVMDPETKYLTAGELPYANKLASYMYGDELDAKILTILDDVKNTYSEWRSRYGNVLAFTDFYSHITPSQILTYMNGAQPDMLCFNHYPHYYNTPDWEDMWLNRKNWYETMQEYRALGVAGYTIDGVNTGPIPYAQFLNLYRMSYSDPLPDESFMRLQYNASWAFGFTDLMGYMYSSVSSAWQAGDPPAVMFSTPGDSSPTAVFNYVAEANRQSRNLGPALVRMVSSGLRMIGGTDHDSRPSSIAAWTPGAGGDAFIKSIIPWNTATNQPDPSYSDVLIGYFNPLLDNNPGYTFVDGLHFMIVNGATGDTPEALAQAYRITFGFGGSGYDALVKLDRDTGLIVPVALTHDGGSWYHLDLTLEGGTGDLFGFWNSSTPLPTIPEPGTLVLLATGLSGLLCYAWRKWK